VKIGLDIASGLFGLAAAGFWFASAWELPSTKTYWDGPPPEVVDAMRRAVTYNRWAAILTGLTVLCQAVGALWWRGGP
jgi:hypothetical protein